MTQSRCHGARDRNNQYFSILIPHLQHLQKCRMASFYFSFYLWQQLLFPAQYFVMVQGYLLQTVNIRFSLRVTSPTPTDAKTLTSPRLFSFTPGVDLTQLGRYMQHHAYVSLSEMTGQSLCEVVLVQQSPSCVFEGLQMGTLGCECGSQRPEMSLPPWFEYFITTLNNL